MFGLSFTTKDLVRSVWTFLGVYLAAALVSALGILNSLVESCNDVCDFGTAKQQTVTLALATASAIVIGIKNLLLADGTTLKG
jgi:hypothetical protein